jgi:hypothetical protein
VLGVFVVDDHDRARFVPAPAAQPGRPFPIILPPEALVVRGQQGLSDGQPVTWVERAECAWSAL